MKKAKIIFIAIIFLILFNPVTNVIAIPALPKQPAKEEPPEPPPPEEEPKEKPPEGSPAPTPLPTPTPCIPSFCYPKHTDCCFMAGCIQVGPFKLGNCLYDSKDKLKTTSDNQPNSTSSFFSRFWEFFKSIF